MATAAWTSLIRQADPMPDVPAPEEAGFALVAVDASLVAEVLGRLVRIMPPSAPATTLVG